MGILVLLGRRSLKEDATKLAFHLRNANIALERVENNAQRTTAQDVKTAELRRALNDATRRADALLALPDAPR